MSRAPTRARVHSALATAMVILAAALATHVVLSAGVSTESKYIDASRRRLFDRLGEWPVPSFDPHRPNVMVRSLPPDWPKTLSAGDEWCSGLFSVESAFGSTASHNFHVHAVRIGLPFRSAIMMDQSSAPEVSLAEGPSFYKPVGEVETDRLRTFSSRLLLLVDPTRILWPGFISNTLMFAAVYLAVFLTCRQGRRVLRRRRGLCLVCAYSRAGLASDASCPECGHAADARHA